MNHDPSTPFVAKAPRAVAIRTIKKWIQEGSIARGMPLPSERELAERLDVSRETVRRALRVMEKDGIVAKRGPRTRIVANMSPKNINEGLLQNTVIVLSTGSSTVPEHRDTGWIDALTQGVLEGTDISGRHNILLQAKRFWSEDPAQLIQGRPTAVMVPDLQGHEIKLVPQLRALAEAEIPTVVYGNRPEFQGYDRVTSNHHQGAYELTKWLIAHGAKRILQLGINPPLNDVYWMQERRTGYKQALREAGLEALPALPIPSSLPDEGNPFSSSYANRIRLIAGYLIDYLCTGTPVDAIMCLSDGDICSVSAACRLHHKSVNKDIMLAGYDHFWDPRWTSFEEPPLVTVDKLNRIMGIEMVKLLEQRLKGELPVEPQCRVITPRLILPI